jgi:hypothetical protein
MKLEKCLKDYDANSNQSPIVIPQVPIVSPQTPIVPPQAPILPRCILTKGIKIKPPNCKYQVMPIKSS